jgi:hypothetical protein
MCGVKGLCPTIVPLSKQGENIALVSKPAHSEPWNNGSRPFVPNFYVRLILLYVRFAMRHM